MSIYQQLKDAGVPISNHASDLFAEVTAESSQIVAGYEFRTQVTLFRDQTTGKMNFEIPFAFEPYFTKAVGGHGQSAAQVEQAEDYHHPRSPNAKIRYRAYEK